MKQEIMSFDAAQMGVIKKLVQNGFPLKNIIPINNNRYSIITSQKKRILLKFTRDTFHTFSSMFYQEGAEGEGDTINENDLDTAIKLGVTEIYSVFPSGIVYRIGVAEFVAKSFLWRNEEGKKVRSISINEYEKLFSLGEE